MIRSFKHAGLKEFFETGSKRGIQPAHASKLGLQLFALDKATEVSDMNVPGWALHSLKGELAGYWAIKVDKNWRMTFRFEDGEAYVVNYQDYH